MEEMTIVTRTEERTPIEIALEVDENGWTTAKKLYDWLELDPSHFSSWVKDRILNNEYADEMEFSQLGAKTSDKGGRPFQDYAISADLAKMLAISSKSEKGKAARNYFQQLEKGLQVTVKQYNELLDCYKQAITMIEEVQTKQNELMEKHDTLALEIKDNTTAINKLESGRSISGGHQSDWATKWHSRVRQLANAMNITVSSAYDRIFNLMGDMHSFIWADVKASYVSRHPEEGKDPWRIDVIDEAKGDLALWFIDAFNELAEPYGLEDYEEAYYEIGCFNPKELSDNIYYHKQSDEEIDEIIKGYYEFCQENGELAYGGN